jgi:hypothetical protein
MSSTMRSALARWPIWPQRWGLLRLRNPAHIGATPRRSCNSSDPANRLHALFLAIRDAEVSTADGRDIQ